MTTSRRKFSKFALGLAATGIQAARLNASGEERGFSFIVLGDLHYDRMEHHDLAWLEAHHPNDLSQIKNYSKITGEVLPSLFSVIHQKIDELKASPTPPALVIQVGDLVEGLCGNEDLALQQNSEALDFIRESKLDLPFLMTKGNHDVTGDGAIEAFRECLLPFMHEQARRVDANATASSANYALTFANTTFAFFDAYDPASLDWLESVTWKRTSQHLIVVIHPPVIPYGARSTWHLYSESKKASQRAKLLDILGSQQAVVLGGHLHKFSWLTRRVGHGLLRQLAVSSVVDSLQAEPRDQLHGIETYTSSQVELEPKHSPDTIEVRRSIYDRERENVVDFEYANTAGYAVVTVKRQRVEASIYAGSQPRPYRVVALS